MGEQKGSDLLVKLYEVKENRELEERLLEEGIRVNRIFPPNYDMLLEYVSGHFSKGWVSETKAALANHPASCYVAIQKGKIIGFACYNATAKDYFGPTGVSEECRGKGVGTLLLIKCLLALKEEGYGYAIIGWSDDATPFYKKIVGATEIPDSIPGLYGQMVEMP
jgi:predicted GNAT family acetyltransferase